MNFIARMAALLLRLQTALENVPAGGGGVPEAEVGTQADRDLLETELTAAAERAEALAGGGEFSDPIDPDPVDPAPVLQRLAGRSAVTRPVVRNTAAPVRRR